MTRLIKAILKKEDWFLRVALAFPMLWAGAREIIYPTDWIGFVPKWVNNFIDPQVFLVAHGFALLVTAIFLLIGVGRILFSAAAVGLIGGILVFAGIDDITFRDVGLAIVAVLLFLKAVAGD